MRVRSARIKKGLPGEKYPAKGYFDEDGRWIVTQKSEETLDDAFRIRQNLEEEKVKKKD